MLLMIFVSGTLLEALDKQLAMAHPGPIQGLSLDAGAPGIVDLSSAFIRTDLDWVAPVSRYSPRSERAKHETICQGSTVAAGSCGDYAPWEILRCGVKTMLL